MANERKGLYRVTFAWPEKQDSPSCPRCGHGWISGDSKYCHLCGQPREKGGAFLDVAHGSGHDGHPDPIRLSTSEPYIGPLSEDEFTFLQSIADGSAARSLSYPPSWKVTLAAVTPGEPTSKGVWPFGR